MLEIFRDELWQFVGAVFGLIAIVVSVWVALRQRQRKDLSLNREFRVPLLQAVEGLGDKVQVLFDGTPVRDAYLVQFTLSNMGTVPILPTDFIEPLRVKFGEKARVLQAHVTQQSPPNLGASVAIQSGHVVLEPLLLNPTDALSIRIVGQGLEEMQTEARVAGLRSIGDEAETKRTLWGSTGDLVGPMLIIVVVAGLALLFQSAFLWGFWTAGLVGFISQRMLLRRSRASVSNA